MNLQLRPPTQRGRGWFHTNINLWGPCKLLFLFNRLPGPAESEAPYAPQQWGPATMGAHLYWTVFACKWQRGVEWSGVEWSREAPLVSSQGHGWATAVGGLTWKLAAAEDQEEPREKTLSAWSWKKNNCCLNSEKHNTIIQQLNFSLLEQTVFDQSLPQPMGGRGVTCFRELHPS